jgi:hypothetical protein
VGVCKVLWTQYPAQCPTTSRTDARPGIQLSQEVEAQILTVVAVHGGYFPFLSWSSCRGRVCIILNVKSILMLSTHEYIEGAVKFTYPEAMTSPKEERMAPRLAPMRLRLCS